MNLGTRCEYMLPNQCQCTNTAIDGARFCLLHLEVGTKLLEENEKEVPLEE